MSNVYGVWLYNSNDDEGAHLLGLYSSLALANAYRDIFILKDKKLDVGVAYNLIYVTQISLDENALYSNGKPLGQAVDSIA